MSAIVSQITSLTIITQPFIQEQIKENNKASRHRPLWGGFTGDQWPVNSPHEGPVTRKMFKFDDVIMHCKLLRHIQ